MIELLLLAAASLGMSENIESRLPEDPHMIYTVSFEHHGTTIGLDWKNRSVVPHRVCRKMKLVNKQSCQQAALSWLQIECDYYDAKASLDDSQRDMQRAVCSGAKELQSLMRAQQLANR